MGITAHTGPVGAFGLGTSLDSNAQISPSFWFMGDMILDPRLPYTYQPGQSDQQPFYGWGTAGRICLIDSIPSTLSTSAIAAAAVPSGGVVTLVSSSGAGITTGCTIVNAATGAKVTGLLGIDVAGDGRSKTFTGTFTNNSPKISFTSTTVPVGMQVGDQVTLTSTGTLPTPFALLTTYYVSQINTGPAGALMLSASLGGSSITATSAGSGTQTVNIVNQGSYYGTQYNAALPYQAPIVFGPTGTNGPARLWNPSWSAGRCVTIRSVGNDSTATFTVNGYDCYGYPMTQSLAGSSGAPGNVTTTKAFKYISSITYTGTLSGSNVSVGQADVFGLPLRTDQASYLTVYCAAATSTTPIALIAPGSLTFVGADITTPTTTTGDVRGTVYSGTASSTDSVRLIVFWDAMQPNIDNTPFGLLGQTQL